MAQPDTGQETPSRPAAYYDIPVQPLVSALDAYSVKSGTPILYDSEIAAGLQSGPVQGAMADDEALRALLAGTGLTFRYTPTASVIVVKLGAESEGPLLSVPMPQNAANLDLDTLHVEGERDFSAYARLVFADLRTALQRDEGTRYRGFKARMRLWIDDRGNVSQVQAVSDEGQSFDREIERVVAGVVMKRPPPRDMPQPIRATIVTH